MYWTRGQKSDLAVRLGVTPSYLIDVLRGRRHISYETAIEWEDTSGIPWQDWLDQHTTHPAFDRKG